MEELVEVVGRNAGHCVLLRDQAFVHHLNRGAHGGMPRSLGPPGLEHVQLAALDRELHVLHIAEVALQQPRHPVEFRVGLRQ